VNWEALGAIANLFAAIGVIATLIYLSIQIRQNNNQLRGADSSVNLKSDPPSLQATAQQASDA
jgi:hypothetical protein